MNEFLNDLWPTLLILLLSGWIQGLLGFGFSIVAITLLPMVLGLKDGVTFMAFMNVVAIGLSMIWNRAGFFWQDTKWMVYGGVAGVPIGVALLSSLNDQVLYFLFGAFLVFVSLSHFVRKKQKMNTAASPKKETVVGLTSGVLAGSFSMGGPPVVAYLYGKDWELERIKSFMATVYMATSIMRLLFAGVSGENLAWVFQLFLVCVLPVAFVLRKGVVLGRRIGVTKLRTVVFAYLGIVGIVYLIGWH